MNYEEKYNNIVAAIKQLQESNPSDEGIQNWVEDNVPELCESEDDRIRKRLIAMCQHYIECYALDQYSVDDYKEALAWLEKQGNDSYLQEKINAFTNAHKGEDPEEIIAACRGYEEQGENSVPSETSSEKELAETYLRILNKKFPILPTLKGKQLADYKNFLNKCQQIFGLKEWGIHPTQSKLFEKLSLIWAVWGAEHLKGLGKSDNEDPCHTCDHPVLSCNAFPCEKKKQAEQKPAWSEEDEKTLNEIIHFFESLCSCLATEERHAENRRWLKFLKSLRPQKWTKEDKERYISCLQRLSTGNPDQPETINTKWFKEHVYPQNTWKPTDEQMADLWNMVCECRPADQQLLQDIYYGLKILKEE